MVVEISHVLIVHLYTTLLFRESEQSERNNVLESSSLYDTYGFVSSSDVYKLCFIHTNFRNTPFSKFLLVSPRTLSDFF